MTRAFSSTAPAAGDDIPENGVVAVIGPDPAPARRDFARALRPRYFAGQLLTADDMNGMVAWCRDTFARAPGREGWGVAAGLTLAADPADPSALVVETGYALDPAGRPVVAGKPVRVDLAPFWRAAAGSMTDGAVVAFAATLAYDETARCNRPVLAYQGRRPDDAGEAARVEEGYVVNLVAIAAGCGAGHAATDPVGRAAARWEQGWRASLNVLDCLTDDLLAGSGRETRQRLRAWIAGHPLRRSPGLADDIDARPDAFFADPAAVYTLLAGMAQDYRLQYLDDTGLAGAVGDGLAGGIPLGRVWLTAGRSGGDGGAARPRLLAVDNSAPWRRVLGPAAFADAPWPAPVGASSAAAGAVGRRWDDAAAMLSGMGIAVAGLEIVDPAACADLAGLRSLLEASAFVRVGEALILSAVPSPGEEPRVIAARPAEAAPREGLRVACTADRRGVRPGEEVMLTATLRNVGLTRLMIGATDTVAGRPLVRETGLPAGGEIRLSWSWRAPADLTPDENGVFRYRVEAVAVAGGVRLAAAGEAALTVDLPAALEVVLLPGGWDVIPGGPLAVDVEAVNTGATPLRLSGTITVATPDEQLACEPVSANFVLAAGERRRFDGPRLRLPAKIGRNVVVAAHVAGRADEALAAPGDDRQVLATAALALPPARSDRRWCFPALVLLVLTLTIAVELLLWKLMQ